jgi:carbamoyltransferase
MDGVGEWATSSIGAGRGNEIILLRELKFPDSLGLLYSAFTYFTGFRVNSGEYKVMGLAPYGSPKYVSLIKDKLVEVCDDGSLRLNQDYFGYAYGLRMTNGAFARLFGRPPRAPESELTQDDMDLARSIQVITEEVVLKMASYAHKETGLKRLCMAGGVALNCVGNGRILREGPFDSVFIQPAAGDAGGALGIALAIWHHYLGRPRLSPEAARTWQPSIEAGLPPYADGMKGTFLGPAYDEQEVEQFLRDRSLPYQKYDRENLPDVIAALIAEENVIGLHQGRMEFGPRALGGRSIIGDARSAKMQSLMNLKIKHRESFRPFAPSVLREHVDEWFEVNTESPYMLLVADVAKNRRRDLTEEEQSLWGIARLNAIHSEIPAVTHVDYSARLQTVRREANPFYWEILEAFRKLTGCPVVVNTSFNVRGEPMVCSPEDSYRCFMRTEMDYLVLENFLLDRRRQPTFYEATDWKKEFKLD